ncbi:hypothetical protein M1403_00945 [Patescibacteria group bacterium]|nr:hypothetical protein [Patescibacteria group bacterium]
MRKNLLVLGLFSLLTIWVTWPLILHMNINIIDRIDGLLITWILNWNVRSFSYNTNIFYPYINTLAFSDLLFPEALIALPFVKIFGEPLLAYNINFLLGFALTGFSLYLLLDYLTKNKPVAFLIGVLFSFSIIHLNYMPHLQLFNFWPVVLATLFMLQKRYRLFILMFLAAALTTVMFFYFLLAIGVIWGIWGISGFKDKLRLAGFLLLAILITAPFLLPYYLVSRQFHYQRPITDAINFSFQVPDLLNIGTVSRLSQYIGIKDNLTPGYLGGVFMLLTVAAMIGVRKMWKQKYTKTFVILAASSFILALGPGLHVFRNTIHVGPIPAIPLPYLVFYYLVPGFAGIRTPSRWIILMAFAFAMVIGLWVGRLKEKTKWAVCVLGTIGILLEISWPLKYVQVPSVKNFPPEQSWLKDNFPGAPIVQFPIYGWWDQPGVETETLREYYSTIHWHPMYNGYSGFSPKEWEESVKWLQKDFPSAETISFLKGKGIKLVVAPNSWKIGLKKVAGFDKDSVYEIL